MDCRLELLVHVIAHLVTTDAKRPRIRDFQCGIEATPKDNARNKAADGEKSQALMLARSSERFQKFYAACDERHVYFLPVFANLSIKLSASSKVFRTSGLTSICGT